MVEKGYFAFKNDIPVGRVKIWPIENGLNKIVSKNFYYMPCIWISPKNQKRGIGKALIEFLIKVLNPYFVVSTFEHVKRNDKVFIEIVEDMFCPYRRVWQYKLFKILE